MKSFYRCIFPNYLLIAFLCLFSIGCNQRSKLNKMKPDTSIVFLHHSTGKTIWNGNTRGFRYTLGRILKKINGKPNNQAQLLCLLREYNRKNHTGYKIDELSFPKSEPYGLNNYPYDYYNIWVKHGGNKPYMEEPTIEVLSATYQVIIFKHCFAVSNIQAEQDSADINSDYKSLANYKLQYMALRDKIHQFPHVKFIVWTGAAHVKSQVNENEAKRAREFFNWVKDEWDLPDDNIFIWDFYQLQTKGSLYFLDEYSRSENNSHPNAKFSDYAADLFFNRIIDVIENNGEKTSLTGENK